MIIQGQVKRIVSRRVERSKPDKLSRTLNMREFFGKRNKVLIIRAVGGLGDILMHRMMFQDFKELIGDGEVHFACPAQYHAAVQDHPYLSKVLDSSTVDKSDYIISYNTTTACGRYEMRMAPFADLNRSDIWSQHCGVTLKHHDMHIQLTESEKQEGFNILENYRDRPGPSVLVCPVSAMMNKNLLDHQLAAVVRNLHERGCYVAGLHNYPLVPLTKRQLPSIHSLNIRQWMSAINAADYVVSVDTSAFHCAGGLKKPLLGIFTFADGKVYGRHYPTAELVQKHRDTDPNWTCGPCYNWGECPKTKQNPKPCLTEISNDMLINGLDRMFSKFPTR